DTTMKILIIGATSAIAHETAKCFAKDGAELFLVGRSSEKLESVQNDLKVRGAKRAESYVLDISQLDRHQEMIEAAIESMGGLDMALIAHGTLSDQRLSQENVTKTLEEFTTNCTSVISLLTLLANYFEPRKHGCIAVISSVAGDRGRQSNYVYGAAKGALTVFLQGLRGRLAKSGVAVVTVKPGFVDTPMTASIRKGLLFASPRKVGEGIYHAMLKGKEVVYLPWFWRPIMLIVKSIPEPLFKKLSI
ncbi:MAG TPA: SDR family oxidoreductase, partial [Ktedonobacteraceae bacterium]|nr:SDR family oxidoreductase [Ktedonobacteraceae bacterium]